MRELDNFQGHQLSTLQINNPTFIPRSGSGERQWMFICAQFSPTARTSDLCGTFHPWTRASFYLRRLHSSTSTGLKGPDISWDKSATYHSWCQGTHPNLMGTHMKCLSGPQRSNGLISPSSSTEALLILESSGHCLCDKLVRTDKKNPKDSLCDFIIPRDHFFLNFLFWDDFTLIQILQKSQVPYTH